MIRANFTAYSSYVTDSLYQWDKNRTLVIDGLNLDVAPEIHFTNASMDKAIVRQSTLENGSVIVDIPNSLLQQAHTIRAYIGIYEGDTFKTIEVIDIPIITREKPSDYTISDTDEEIYSFKALENQIANIVANANSTEGNSELVDIRKGADGKIYTSAGEAVREQLKNLKQQLQDGLDNVQIEMDDEMSDTSENAVKNKVVKAYIDKKIADVDIPCDTEMSNESTNPVQNKVIKGYVDAEIGDLSAQLVDLDNDIRGSKGINITDLSPYETHSGYMLRPTDANNWSFDERFAYKVIPITEIGCTFEIQAKSGSAYFCGLKNYVEPTNVTDPCEFSSVGSWITRRTVTATKITDIVPDDVRFILVCTKMSVSGVSTDVEFATFKIHKDSTDGLITFVEKKVSGISDTILPKFEKVKYDLYGDIFTVNEEISTTFKGIDITRVGDTFILNGTAEETSVGTINILLATLDIKQGYKYTLSGCPQGGGDETYWLKANGFVVSDVGNGATGSSVNDTTKIYIFVKSGVTLENVVFAPSFVEQKQSKHIMRDYLFDKTIMAIGDSMVYGQNVGLDNTWLAKIGERTGANTINKGSNGAFMSNYPYGISNPKYTSVYQKICNPDNEQGEYIDDETLNSCDYILIFAGTNDSNSPNPVVPIGEVDSVDPLEFCGAINCIIQKLYERVPTIKIGFITPYQKKDSTKRTDIISAIKNVCAKYAIPVFDNSLNGGFIFENEHQAQALTLGDNVHLNVLGHEYVSTKYEAFLRTL